MRRFRKFKQVTTPTRGSRSESVVREIIEPFRGMRTDVSRHALRPGESGDMLNFFVDRGRLRSRPSTSSITQYSSSVISCTPNSGNYVFFTRPTVSEANTSSEYAAVAIVGAQGNPSALSVVGLFPANNGWQRLGADSKVSFSSAGRYTHDTFRFPDVHSGALTWIIAGDPTDVPIIGNFEDSSSAVTILENFSSVASGAGGVAVFDDRVLFANENAGGTNFPQRFRWTARGKGADFTSVGAGFEDLNELDGPIRFLHPAEDQCLIFSSDVLMRATPRRDEYAFDFDVIDPRAGCDDPALLVETRHGQVWLYKDRLMRFAGNVVRELSPTLSHQLRPYAWRKGSGDGVVSIAYSNAEDMLLLYAAQSSSSNATMYALDLKTLRVDESADEAVWTQHRVAMETGIVTGGDGPSIGAMMAVSDPPTKVPFSDVYQPLRHPMLIPYMSSGSTAVVHLQEMTGPSTDICEFTTHAIEGKRDSRTMDLIREVGIDYEVVGSNASVWIGVSDDLGASYTTVASNKAMPSGKSHIDIACEPLRARNPIVKVAVRTAASGSTIYIDRLSIEGRAWTGRR